MKTYKVAVTGGREHEITGGETARFRRILLAREQISRWGGDPDSRLVVIHGNARGVDRRATEIAEEAGYPTVPFNAPWDAMKHLLGEDDPRWKAAGNIRNGQLLAAADLLVAFPGGRGTADCVRQAERKGIEVVRIGGGG